MFCLTYTLCIILKAKCRLPWQPRCPKRTIHSFINNIILNVRLDRSRDSTGAPLSTSYLLVWNLYALQNVQGRSYCENLQKEHSHRNSSSGTPNNVLRVINCAIPLFSQFDGFAGMYASFRCSRFEYKLSSHTILLFLQSSCWKYPTPYSPASPVFAWAIGTHPPVTKMDKWNVFINWSPLNGQC